MNPKFKRGTELPFAKLNEASVRRIRTEHAEKERLKRELDAKYSAKAFAQRYGVAIDTITKVLSHQTWGHVL